MTPRAAEPLSARIARVASTIIAGLALLFLAAPVLAVVPLSFSSGNFLTYPLPGLSLRWYHEFVSTPQWTVSLRNSLIVGVFATMAATVLGTLAALGLSNARLPWRGAIMTLILSPMIVPVVVLAVGVTFFFSVLGLTNSFLGLMIAHTTLGVPFVVVTVTATLSGFDISLTRAAASLGASPATVLRRVILPIIAPGLLSGAVFAFATSFDEVVMALFISGPAQMTLPKQMFLSIRETISPTLLAAAVLMTLFSTSLLLAIELLRRRAERLRGTRGTGPA
jgi:putative spermidine/putrescine transport system permease protein